MLRFILIGLFSGICSGVFGIGGAIIMIPSLIYVAHFSQHMAQGTTLAAMVVPCSFLAAYRYWQEGYVNGKVAAILAIGLFLGGYFGAMIAIEIPEVLLRRIFGVLLLFTALWMIS